MNTLNKVYYSAGDLVEMLDVSRATAYKIIRHLNTELEADGYIILQGKIPKAYFCKKWYGLDESKVVEGA